MPWRQSGWSASDPTHPAKPSADGCAQSSVKAKPSGTRSPPVVFVTFRENPSPSIALSVRLADHGSPIACKLFPEIRLCSVTARHRVPGYLCRSRHSGFPLVDESPDGGGEKRFHKKYYSLGNRSKMGISCRNFHHRFFWRVALATGRRTFTDPPHNHHHHENKRSRSGQIVIKVTGTNERPRVNGLQITVVPEPSAALLGGIGLFALLRSRR